MGFRLPVRWVWLGLALLIGASLPAGKPKAWIEIQSPHFTLCSDADPREARRIVRQFEEIRMVFRGAFPRLRVDSGQPTHVIALEDEDSMKAFTPWEFESSKSKRAAGMFLHAEDRDYALLRLDATHDGNQPYAALYHEYTHKIIRLNFATLPTWLSEGLADYYGATEVGADEVRIGKVPQARLNLLRQSGFLDLEALFQTNRQSAHYREAEKAHVFYAESWALVHYLLTDAQAQSQGLLGRYLAALDRTGDPVAAGREAFGDLKRFLPTLVAYARQPRFQFRVLNLSTNLQDHEIRERPLRPAEALILRAEFLQRSSQDKEARPLILEALKLEPAEPSGHAALGYSHLIQKENEEALRALTEAQRLQSRDFRVPFWAAGLQRRKGLHAEATSLLEASRALNPEFAPVQSQLSEAYRRNPETRAKAIDAARRAVQLEPARLQHRVRLGEALLAAGRLPEAHMLGEQLSRMARTEAERAQVQEFLAHLQRGAASEKPTLTPPAPAPSAPVP